MTDTPQGGIPRLITAQDVAAQTGIPLQRVYALARDGHLPVIHFGRAMRFDPWAVRDWLARGGTAPRDAR